MTRTIQNKSKTSISNNDIISNLIKKENGVNPFLTVMNFKISFKTWLKFAREEIQMTYCVSKDQKEKLLSKRLIEAVRNELVVEIDQEHFVELTSDEDTISAVDPFSPKASETLHTSFKKQESMRPKK